MRGNQTKQNKKKNSFQLNLTEESEISDKKKLTKN